MPKQDDGSPVRFHNVAEPAKGQVRRMRTHVNVGFPHELFETIKRMAIDERRSFTAQVVVMCEAYKVPK